MKEIALDASRWRTFDDLFASIFRALGAPDWHGASVDALIDSMVYGGINELEPPYVLDICGVDGLPEELRSFLVDLRRFIAEHVARTVRVHGEQVAVSLRLDGEAFAAP